MTSGHSNVKIRAMSLKKMIFRAAKRLADYSGDGLIVTKRNLSFLNEGEFASAWRDCETSHGGKLPSIHFRAKAAIDAAKQALLTDGLFVECGVNTGILSYVVCRALDFGSLPRRFFLFDTYEGIPLEGLSGIDLEKGEKKNNRGKRYPDCYEETKARFAPFKNVELVRGVLPATLDVLPDEKIAYLSVDLNSATYEMQVMERLWPRLSDRAVVLIDDYGFAGMEQQYAAWSDFAKGVGRPIFLSPSGQGMMFK